MTRIRIYRPNTEGKLVYMNTVYLDHTPAGAGALLVAEHGMLVGDVAYMGDFFLRLTRAEPVQWSSVDPTSLDVQGLYGQAVAAERLHGAEYVEW